jgi:hypothetical protein
VVLARPTKSEILYTQIVGRGLRTAAGKIDCLILDHSDTTLRLGFVSDIHHEKLDDGRYQKGTAGAAERKPALPKECKACSYLKPAGVHKCPSCGFAPERQSHIEDRAGSLVQLNGKRKGKTVETPESKQRFYSMLIWIARDRGYQAGYAANRYKAKFGVWPRNLIEAAVPPDATVLNWLKAQQIAYRKGKAKAEQRGHANAA